MAYISCRGKKRTPRVLPSFDVAGRPVERIVPPGKKLGTGLDNGLGEEGSGLVTCACNACQTLYAQETAA